MCDNDTHLVHRVLLYRTEREFVDAVVPYLREGIANGERVVVVTMPRKLALLEDGLGRDAIFVESLDGPDFSGNPARRLASIHAIAQGTRRVRAVGELSWSSEGREREEWARYESLVNVALAAVDADLLCLYDSGALGPDVLRTATMTHPFLGCGAGSRPNRGYVDPADFAESFDAAPLPEPEGPTESLEFRADHDLRAVRRFVRRLAVRGGLAADHMEPLLIAANEVATNALRHGGGSGTIRCWLEPGGVACEVTSPRGRIDPFAGFLPSGLDQTGGRGLWLVRQLCDVVEIRSRDSGTLVRLHVRGGSDWTV